MLDDVDVAVRDRERERERERERIERERGRETERKSGRKREGSITCVGGVGNGGSSSGGVTSVARWRHKSIHSPEETLQR